MQPVINIDSWINKLADSKVSTGFRDGQIFAGKNTKFYPHNMAEVLVNGTKLMAKLEVSEEAHVRQLFQVSQTECLKNMSNRSGHDRFFPDSDDYFHSGSEFNCVLCFL